MASFREGILRSVKDHFENPLSKMNLFSHGLLPVGVGYAGLASGVVAGGFGFAGAMLATASTVTLASVVDGGIKHYRNNTNMEDIAEVSLGEMHHAESKPDLSDDQHNGHEIYLSLLDEPEVFKELSNSELYAVDGSYSPSNQISKITHSGGIKVVGLKAFLEPDNRTAFKELFTGLEIGRDYFDDVFFKSRLFYHDHLTQDDIWERGCAVSRRIESEDRAIGEFERQKEFMSKVGHHEVSEFITGYDVTDDNRVVLTTSENSPDSVRVFRKFMGTYAKENKKDFWAGAQQAGLDNLFTTEMFKYGSNFIEEMHNRIVEELDAVKRTNNVAIGDNFDHLIQNNPLGAVSSHNAGVLAKNSIGNSGLDFSHLSAGNGAIHLMFFEPEYENDLRTPSERIMDYQKESGIMCVSNSDAQLIEAQHHFVNTITDSKRYVLHMHNMNKSFNKALAVEETLGEQVDADFRIDSPNHSPSV